MPRNQHCSHTARFSCQIRHVFKGTWKGAMCSFQCCGYSDHCGPCAICGKAELRIQRFQHWTSKKRAKQDTKSFVCVGAMHFLQCQARNAGKALAADQLIGTRSCMCNVNCDGQDTSRNIKTFQDTKTLVDSFSATMATSHKFLKSCIDWNGPVCQWFFWIFDVSQGSRLLTWN